MSNQSTKRYRVVQHGKAFSIHDTKRDNAVVGRSPTREGANRIRRSKEKHQP